MQPTNRGIATKMVGRWKRGSGSVTSSLAWSQVRSPVHGGFHFGWSCLKRNMSLPAWIATSRVTPHFLHKQKTRLPQANWQTMDDDFCKEFCRFRVQHMGQVQVQGTKPTTNSVGPRGTLNLIFPWELNRSTNCTGQNQHHVAMLNAFLMIKMMPWNEARMTEMG